MAGRLGLRYRLFLFEFDVANAAFDATGVRFRQSPMRPTTIRDALKAAGVS